MTIPANEVSYVTEVSHDRTYGNFSFVVHGKGERKAYMVSYDNKNAEFYAGSAEDAQSWAIDMRTAIVIEASQTSPYVWLE